MMLAPDREQVRAVARRFFAAGLGCGVETQCEGRWEPCVLALRSASPDAVLAEVEQTLARGVRVRLAAYSPSSLTRIDVPAPVICPELRYDLHADLVLVARGTRVLDG
jgi:hypothetical protein